MDRKRLFNNIINFFSGKSAQGVTPEDRLFLELHEAARRLADRNPPEEVYRQLREKMRLVEDTGYPMLLRKRPRLGWLYLASGAVAAALLVGTFALLTHQPGVEFETIAKRDVVARPGIQARAEVEGKLALVESEASRSFIIESGRWTVESDHNGFEKETWFHFPGGGLRPIGTRFTIDATGKDTRVELAEGSILVYRTDDKGEFIETRVYTESPSEPFAGPALASAKVAEERQRQVNNYYRNQQKEAMQRDMIPPKPMSIYEHYIGADITVRDKHGDMVSGVLVDVSKGIIVIKNSVNTVYVEEKNMTLVGLDVHPEGLVLEPKKR